MIDRRIGQPTFGEYFWRRRAVKIATFEAALECGDARFSAIIGPGAEIGVVIAGDAERRIGVKVA